MHEAEPEHAFIGITPHRAYGSDSIEVTGASHDAMSGKRVGNHSGRSGGMERHGRHPPGFRSKAATAEDADVVAVTEEIEQRFQPAIFMRTFHRGHHARPRGGIGIITEMMGIQGIDIIRHAGGRRDLRMVRPGRGKPLHPRAGVEEMRLVGKPVGKAWRTTMIP